jgi:hypothetical protein
MFCTSQIDQRGRDSLLIDGERKPNVYLNWWMKRCGLDSLGTRIRQQYAIFENDKQKRYQDSKNGGGKEPKSP